MMSHTVNRFALACALIAAAVVLYSSLSAKKVLLRPGSPAPDFDLRGDDGSYYQLSDFNDRKVVLFFYPRDESYYCTRQVCSLASGYEQLTAADIVLFGINHESAAHHAAFKKKHQLPFALLSDPSCAVIKAYGAYSFFWTKRMTVLIDKGRIVKTLHDINVTDHADQIMNAFGLSKSTERS